MARKNARKIAARARQRMHGGRYQHHLRQVEGWGTPIRVLITRWNGRGDLETTAIEVIQGAHIAVVKLSPVAEGRHR
jgi:hypothetical protein